MDIGFSTRKLQKACNSSSTMQAEWGQQMARKLQQRLLELRAAETLAQISHLPPTKLHELGGDLKGKLSIDLVHPYRLLIEPDHHPLPLTADGGLDRSRVTAVIVVNVVDTH